VVSHGQSPLQMREDGSVVLIVLALVAAVGVMGAIGARQLLQHRRLTDRAHQRAILRNLAEASITSAAFNLARGRLPPAVVLPRQTIGRYEGEARLRLEPAGVDRRLTATSTLFAPGRQPLRYVIRAVARRQGRQVLLSSWTEGFVDRSD
jgi:hypothetical protein